MKKVIIIILIVLVVVTAILFGTGTIGGKKDKPSPTGDEDGGGENSDGEPEVSAKVKSIHEGIVGSFGLHNDDEQGIVDSLSRLTSQSEYTQLKQYFQSSTGKELDKVLKEELSPTVIGIAPFATSVGSDYYTHIKKFLNELPA